MATHYSIHAWDGQMSPAGYSPWGHKDLDAAECARARVHTHTHTHENLFESYSDSNFRSDGKEAT